MSLVSTPNPVSPAYSPKPEDYEQIATCGHIVPIGDEKCPIDGLYVGAPNVRMASVNVEQIALNKRFNAANSAAVSAGCEHDLRQLMLISNMSGIVLARSLRQVDDFVNGKNTRLVSFHHQVASGARAPELNRWDWGRTAVESTIHPFYFNNIQYAALSATGYGVSWFGKYSIKIRYQDIEDRVSLFEENPFLFMDRHQVIAGTLPPPGFRARWEDRAKLAGAKLHNKLQPGMNVDQINDLLISSGNIPSAADFIEAHIFGPIHPASIEELTGPPPQPNEQSIFDSIVHALGLLGAKFVQRDAS